MSLSTGIVNYHFELDSFKLKNQDLISSWIKQIFLDKDESFKQLNYIFCSDDYLLDINQRFLNHDYYTDIITFPISKNPIESDIFISIDRVKDNATDRNITFENELHRVMIHGVLHLLGQADGTEEEKKQMRNSENDALYKLESLA